MVVVVVLVVAVVMVAVVIQSYFTCRSAVVGIDNVGVVAVRLHQLFVSSCFQDSTLLHQVDVVTHSQVLQRVHTTNNLSVLFGPITRLARPSVCLSVCPSVPYGLVTQKKQKNHR